MTDLVTAFDESAARYDFLTRLNPGYHAHLRRAAQVLGHGLNARSSHLHRGKGGSVHEEPNRIWDLGCGTGSSTRAIIDAVPGSRITGVDISPGMLDEAAKKQWPTTVDFQLGAVDDPDILEQLNSTGRPSGVLAAYLFRNITSGKRDASLQTLFSALEPGGTLVVHDYSVKGSPAAAFVWTLVCWLIIIPLSMLNGEKPRLYKYLWRSVLQNDSTQEFTQRLSRAGFSTITITSGRGWHRGILHTYTASKASTK